MQFNLGYDNLVLGYTNYYTPRDEHCKRDTVIKLPLVRRKYTGIKIVLVQQKCTSHFSQSDSDYHYHGHGEHNNRADNTTTDNNKKQV